MPKAIPKISRLPKFIMDGGNWAVKIVCGEYECLFVHKIAELTPAAYANAMDRYGKTAPLDFIAIDGRYFVVGETAQSYEVIRRQRRAKYTVDYYGVLFASAVARMFFNNPESLESGLDVIASHASADYEFRAELRASIKRNWNFECGGVKFKFPVLSVQTFEEPFGGYAMMAFNKTKRGWETPLNGLAVGILDIGGGTCGCLGVSADGTIRYNVAASGEHGINSAIEALKVELQHVYRDRFKTGAPSENRLQQALQTNVYRGGGYEIPCEREVERALNPVLNDVFNLYTTSLGGGADYDLIALTGGGNGILYNKVQAILNHGNVHLVTDPKYIHMANVRGAQVFDAVLSEGG
jgi:hypothetical protein